MMNRRTMNLWIALPALAFLTLPAARAQAPQPAWSRARYVKAKPGKRAEFEKFYLDTIKKYHQARKDAGKERMWSFSRIVYPDGANTRADYISLAVYDKFPSLDESPAENAPFWQQAGTTGEKAIAILSELSTFVGSRVTVQLERIGPRDPGDLIRLDFVKVAPANRAEYVQNERNMHKPLHQERINQGLMKSWGLSGVVLPAGTERPFDYITSNSFKEGIGYGAGGFGGPDLFKKVHPNANLTVVTNRTNELRSIVRSEVIKILEIVR